MGQIKKNPYVNGNNVSYSLMRFHVSINIRKNENNLYFQLVVTNSEMEELVFNFNTFENAIYFTENVINNCHNFAEIQEAYDRIYKQGKYAPKEEPKEQKTKEIDLTPDEVDQAIIEYFGKGKNYRVSVTNEMYVDYHREPRIIFYLIEHLNYDGVKRDIKTCLTEGDLQHALNAYINFYNYELIDFKYNGGVHYVGMLVDEDTPYYNGMKLYVTEKTVDKPKSLEKVPPKKKESN